METYCYMKNCKYRSKRKSQQKSKGGLPLYKCTRYDNIIARHSKLDIGSEDIDYDLLDNMSYCLNYEKIENEE